MTVLQRRISLFELRDPSSLCRLKSSSVFRSSGGTKPFRGRGVLPPWRCWWVTETDIQRNGAFNSYRTGLNDQNINLVSHLQTSSPGISHLRKFVRQDDGIYWPWHITSRHLRMTHLNTQTTRRGHWLERRNSGKQREARTGMVNRCQPYVDASYMVLSISLRTSDVGHENRRATICHTFNSERQ